MIIGIDIDDTIARTNPSLLEEAIRFDIEYVNGKGFKNKDAYSLTELFYWTEDDLDRFMSWVRNGDALTDIAPITGATLYVNKLYDMGFKIYFITRRKNTANMLKVTMKWLEKHGFKYHKLILGIVEKGKICSDEMVDLFIDNDIKHVTEVAAKGIKVLLMTDSYNIDCTVFTRVDTWEDVYKYITK